MRIGIIGLPQVGKTSIFRVLTRSETEEGHRRAEAHIGIAKVPDSRLDRLAALFSPQKITYATVECVDLAAISKETLQQPNYLNQLRQMDTLMHVVRAFDDPAVPHEKGSIDPARDIADVDVELIVNDLSVIENRLARIEKDRKKNAAPDLEKEQALLERAKAVLESTQPLRTAAWTPEESKRLRGFAFLSEKPMLIALNLGEDQVSRREEILKDPRIASLLERPQTKGTAVCGKLESELALMPDAEAAEFLQSYGLSESGLVRLIRAAHELLGLIVFFTVGEKECRAWNIPRGATAVQAAGTIHSDLEKHFIRAEVIRWDQLLEAGDFAAARQKGLLRLEGKDYIVQDGDIVHIRHSG